MSGHGGGKPGGTHYTPKYRASRGNQTRRGSGGLPEISAVSVAFFVIVFLFFAWS